MSVLEMQEARQIAGLELNALRFVDALPASEYEGARISRAGTPIFDLGGERLFYRFPVAKRGARPGYADVAVHPALGAPFLAAATGLEWDEKALFEQARARSRRVRHDEVRFVAYSFPKVAVQFLRAGEERLMLELGTWARVPPAADTRRKPLEPGNFERWSLLDELPAARKRSARKRFELRGQETNVWCVGASTQMLLDFYRGSATS